MTKKPLEKVIRKENYTFDYFFNDKELKEKSKQLANACEQRQALEDEKKAISSEFKAKLDAKNAEINIISGHVSTGKERIYKTCEVEYDYDNGNKIFRYLINDELKEVGREKMTAADYQLSADID